MLGKILNKVGGLVGLGGGQGDYYKANAFQSAGQDALKGDVEAMNSANVKDLVEGLSTGKITLQEALKKAKNPAEINALANSAVGSSLVASEQVRNDPLTSGLLGKDGSLSRALGEEKDLASRGFSLQPEDYEAYGQASDNIARMFGQSEQSLSQALASRGMTGSNTATAQFTGLQGNKNEQLGQMQRQIANDRMNKNLERLSQTRSYLTNLGGLGQDALNSAANRNMNAGNLRMNTASSLAGNELGSYQAQESARQASQQSKEANKQLGLSDALASGLYKGVESGASSAVSYGSGGLTGMNKYNASLPQKSKTGIG